MQDEVNRLADIFVETVARNRGLDADAVRGLQAGCLFGPSAIAAGLGDAIGTLESVGAVMPDEDVPPDDGEDAETERRNAALLSHGIEPTGNAAHDAAAANMATAGADLPGSVELAFTPEDRAKMDRAEVADALSAAGLPPPLLAALLLPAANVTPDTAAARIAHAKALADICAAAGLPDVAADYATKNTDLETARAQLIAVKAEDGPEIVTAHPAKSAGSPLRAAAIYEERRKATE